MALLNGNGLMYRSSREL